MILNRMLIAKQKIVSPDGITIAEEVLYRGSGNIEPPWDLRLMLNIEQVLSDKILHINVMPRTFPVLNELEAILPIRKYKDRLVFEVVERGIHQNLEAIIAFAKKGYILAMDDFGSGSANFAILDRVPAESMPIVKADMGFLHNWPLQYVSDTVGRIQSRGHKVYLEGVEKLEHLIGGADGYQGWLFHKPSTFEIVADNSRITLCPKCKEKACA